MHICIISIDGSCGGTITPESRGLSLLAIVQQETNSRIRSTDPVRAQRFLQLQLNIHIIRTEVGQEKGVSCI